MLLVLYQGQYVLQQGIVLFVDNLVRIMVARRPRYDVFWILYTYFKYGLLYTTGLQTLSCRNVPIIVFKSLQAAEFPELIVLVLKADAHLML